MPMVNLPFLKPLFESPFVKAFEQRGGLEVVLLAVQPSKLADALAKLCRTIPDGESGNPRRVLQGAGRLREAESAFARAVASPSITNHRRRPGSASPRCSGRSPMIENTERGTVVMATESLGQCARTGVFGAAQQASLLRFAARFRDGGDPVLTLALTEAWLANSPTNRRHWSTSALAELQVGADRRAEKTAWEFLDQKSTDEKTVLRMLSALNQIGLTDYGAGHFQDACRVFEKLYPFNVARLGSDHEQTLLHLHNLAMSQRRAGQLPEGRSGTSRCSKPSRCEHMEPTKSERIEYLERLITTLEEDKQFARALEQRQLLLADQRKASPDDDPRLAQASSESPTRGLRMTRRSTPNRHTPMLSIREKKIPDDWLTFNARSRLELLPRAKKIR